MKKIFSIILVIFVIGAWIFLGMNTMNISTKYEEYLANAEQAYQQGYYLEALAHAENAGTVEEIDNVYAADVMKRNSYYGLEAWDSFESQCLSMIKKYPEQEENYELLVQYYIDNQMIDKLCKYVPNYLASWPENYTLLNAYDVINSSYDYVPTGYYDVNYASPTVVDIQNYEKEVIEEQALIIRRLANSIGNNIFDKGYAKIVVSQSADTCFVCDQKGNWKKVDINDYLLARNLNVNFETIGRLSTNNIATAMIDGKCRFINGEMKVSDIVWEDAGTFYNGINGVKKNGKWALVTTDNWAGMTEFPYSNIPFNSQDCCATDGYCVVADSQGYYILETENFKPVSSNVYEELKAFESTQPTAYRKDDKWGFVNKYGEVYIEAMYEDAKPFINGYAAVKQNGLWGYIDKDNNIVVEPQFQNALNVLPSGYAYVQDNMNLWNYVVIHRLFYSE